MNKPKIPLTKDTIDHEDLKYISDWILTTPRQNGQVQNILLW